MRTLTMEDKLALIVAGLTAAGVTVRSLYNSYVKDKDDTSDNRRKDFQLLIDEFRSQNKTLKERVDKLDDQLKQQSSQLEIQNIHITKLSKMLKKAINVIEKLGEDPKEHGIRDITKEA